MDYLPALQNHGSGYAFVSKRTGKAEVWLNKSDENSALQLTNFQQRNRFYQLVWSPNDKVILAITSNGMLLISANNREIQWLPLELAERRTAWWLSDNLIVFQQKLNNEWVNMQFDLRTNLVSKSNASYLSTLLGDDNSEQTLSLINLHCAQSGSYKFHLIKGTSERVFCFDHSLNNIIQVDPNNGTVKKLFPVTYLTSFDVNSSQIISSLQSSLTADIMRTKQQ